LDLEKLKADLDAAQSQGMKVVLTMLSLPGDRWRQFQPPRGDLLVPERGPSKIDLLVLDTSLLPIFCRHGISKGRSRKIKGGFRCRTITRNESRSYNVILTWCDTSLLPIFCRHSYYY
jgi:hypothetical protein